MAESLVSDQLLEDLERLPAHLRRRVQEFAHTLVVTTPPGTPSEALLPFFGTLDDESAREMEKAISRHCELIESDAG